MTSGTGTVDGEYRCDHCGATFDDERERAWHWRTEHRDDLTGEELHAAIDEEVRRGEAAEFTAEFPLTIPRATFAYVVEREHGAVDDLADYDPEDFEDALNDQLCYEPEFTVEGREDPIRWERCGHRVAFDEDDDALPCSICDEDGD